MVTRLRLLVAAMWGRRWGPRTQAVVEAGSVSTSDLCETWRQTTWLLRDLPSDSPDRAMVVDARRRLLDELERRDSPGFVRWMRTETGASSPRSGPRRPRR